MNLYAILFVISSALLLFFIPRRLATLPLLAGTGYMTLGQDILVGPLHFTIIRILVAVGALRIVARGERIQGGMQKLDRMMIAWGCCAVLSSFFHEKLSSSLIARLALCYDGLGLYFLFRFFIQGPDILLSISKIIVIVLAPVAVEMVLESMTGHNNFSFLGGVSPECEVRNGHVRAQGPFSHAILAGTVGAVCWPLLLPYWKRQRKLAILCMVICGTMVVTSRSSGPIMTGFSVLAGLYVWKIRQHMTMIRRGAVGAIAGLNIVMNAPVYYLLARIDFTGSSTGWHRAELINATIKHFDEWWFSGTDYTRHWMPTGVDWSPDHTDITNHYIKMGVIGGLPLMLLFIGVLTVAFGTVGKALKASRNAPIEKQFTIWTLGAILFGHAATMMSVTYFDQSIAFFMMVLAGIAFLFTEAKNHQNNKRNSIAYNKHTWATSL